MLQKSDSTLVVAMQLDEIILFSKLSWAGKKNALALRKKIRKHDQEGGLDAITEDAALTGIFRKSLLASDQGYVKFIPSWYKKKNGTTESYHRFIKIATMLLAEHESFFNAFDIAVDDAARQRSVLFSFIKRVYDDLVDDVHANPAEVYAACRGILSAEQTDPEYRLLAHFKSINKQLTPREKFPHFYAILPQTHELQSAEATSETAQDITFKKAQHSFLADSYIMVDDLSQNVITARAKTAELFQCCDDMYDLDEDARNGKKTYLNQTANPVIALQDKYDEIAAYMKNVAPHPELFLRFMYRTMQIVVHSHEKHAKE
jgi:hypothetical protein